MSDDYAFRIVSQSDPHAVEEMKDLVDDVKDAIDELNKDKVKPVADTAALDDVETASKDAKTAIDAVDDTTITPQVDTSDLADAASVAADAKSAIESVDDTTITPQVDTSDLSNAAGAADGVGSSLEGVEGKAGGADQAIGELSGKAIRSLPGVGAALGPMAENLGQITAKAAQGEMSMAKLAGTGALIGVTALVVKGLGDAFEHAKEKADQAFKKDQVQSFQDIIKETGGTVDALAASFEKAGEIKVHLFEGANLDITPALAAAGVSADQFSAAIAGGEEGLGKLQEALKATGLDAGAQSLIMAGAKDAADNFATAQENAAAFAKVFGGGVDDTTSKLLNMKDRGLDAASTGADGLQDSLLNMKDRGADPAAESIDSVSAALIGAQTQMGILSGQLSDEQAWLSVQDSIDAYIAKMGQADATDRQKHQALLTAQQDLLTYAQSIKDLPPEQMTKITAEIADGNLAAADADIQAFIDKQRPPIPIAVVPHISGKGEVSVVAGNIKINAAGNESFVGGLSSVSEQGGEDIYLPRGTRIVNRANTAYDRAFGAGGAGVTVNVTVQGALVHQNDLMQTIADGLIDLRARGVLPAGALG